VTETALGGGDTGESAYAISHKPVIEWIVVASDPETREAAFDAGLEALYSAIAANRTLGGDVDFVEFFKTQRSNLVTDALPGAKGILVTLEMTFTSARPF